MNPEVRNLAMWCHLSALAMFVVPPPIGNILGPLIVWMTYRDRDPFIYEQGKESVNFQLSMAIYLVVSGLLIFVVIGLVLAPIIGLLMCILPIIAALRARDGVPYRYPLTIRFLV